MKKTATSRTPAKIPKKTAKTQEQWQDHAERELSRTLLKAHSIPGIRRLGPKGSWVATVQVVASPEMARLNRKFRGKNRATDVLSFVSPDVFYSKGELGELVICLPVLKRQAREIGHEPESELRVLLIHGVLHLLGLDHEKSDREAARMAMLEREILAGFGATLGKGLIQRTR